MLELKNRMRQLLENKQVGLIIGYGNGFRGPRPIFVTDPAKTERLIYNQHCTQNLAVYLNKPEVKAFGKVALVASMPALRAVLQLAAENQLKEENIVVITITNDGNIIEFKDFIEIENYVAANIPEPLAVDRHRIDEIMTLSREERWNWWVEELSSCIKCYACRSACPLCYCTKCTVESNQPQWIPIAAHGQGNLEWHLIRAMHLAGRCVECNECAKACPMDLPINLLTQKLNEDIYKEFGSRGGTKATLDYALSSFKTEDKENFIR